MCEITAFIAGKNGEEEIMQDVAVIKVDGKELILTDILGQQKVVEAQIRELRLLEHKVFLA